MSQPSHPTTGKLSHSRAPRRMREIHAPDRLFHLALKGMAWAMVVLLVGMIVFLANLSSLSLTQVGRSFFTSREWHPGFGEYGALSFVYGTAVSSFLALLISAPLSVGAALFLSELAPKPLAAVLSFLIEMLAAIPSVVYGLWGIFVLAPFLRTHVQPVLGQLWMFGPLFEGPPFGVGMLAAGIVLAIMITPTVCAVSRDVFRAVPRSIKEAALGLGATRWEMLRLSVLRASSSGVIGAIILGLGRALGETMAVTMVIGNRAQISASLFAPAQTMASVIAGEYAEASDPLHQSSLALVGLSLFFVSLVINGCARAIIWRMGGRR